MLWIEKYRPRSFAEIEDHCDIIDTLRSYSVHTMPHLMIHGGTGHGKRTLLHALINHLYGSVPDMRHKKVEMATGTSKSIDVSFLEAEEFIEIGLSEYGRNDKLVVQTIVKQIAQTKPMLTLFKKKDALSIKILAITDAGEMSKHAQSALRRTIEMYSSNLRVILICEQLSTIIEPIRSRFLVVRVPGFEQGECERICEKILAKENFCVDKKVVSEICEAGRGNLKKALCLLETHCFNQAVDAVKRQKVEKPVVHLDWERQVRSIAALMKREQSSQALKTIREDMYSLLGTCIPPRSILVALLNALVENVSFTAHQRIVEQASLHDERLKLGTKSIVHLESFVASVLVVLGSKV